ncbi:class I adenylate-forming enzyme family protein [Aquabacterium sp.]|uniref:class I adenylate-forming enzyme family protein n=1 Tax=Aquabacterium sp. TaxID=1872578 RepID=UPI002BA0F2B6|nr:AMP-binding protein [Aquabacterium sp.]HSW04514.1 AMP-binding protein [Aquabacterium sp.]
MYLTQGLHRSLQRHPAKTALTHLGADGAQRQHRFDELVDGVARQAAALAARGVDAGDRVALLAPNDDRLVQAIFACWWRGAVACPLNVRWTPTELAHALADSAASLVLVDEALAERLPRSDIRCITLPRFADEAAALAPLPDSRSGGDAMAVLLYTGGTTGRAKGVMLTHANLWSASMTRAAELPNPPDGVSLLVAPLFHVAGLGRLVGQTLVGGGCVTMAQFRPEAVIAAIEQHRIGDIMVVPTMLQSLLDDPNFQAERVQSLTRIAFGAAPMPPDLLERALAAWPEAEFFQAYGLTETAGAVCINLPVNHRSAEARAAGRLNSVGRAGLGAEIVVTDPDGQEVPRGVVGEVLCRGPMVTPGYWRNPEATAAALQDGWLHTGDAGCMQADGTLAIVDRLKDMIISGGENIYSAEVEAALRAHPAVAQAAVLGVPDARWGEAVQAFVVLREPVSDEVLRAWCRERLAGYKCPRAYAFVAELPLSAAGKVLKNVLRQQAGA